MKDQIRTAILKVVDEWGEIYISDIPSLIPEASGEFAIYAPLKHGCNPNVLMANGVSSEMIEVFNDVVQSEQILEIEPRSPFFAMIDGATLYGPEFANEHTLKSKKHCFLPAILKRKKNQ